MAKKRVPDNWRNLKGVSVKWINGHGYVYQYNPATQREDYLGAMEPVPGIIDSLSMAQKTKLIRMFNRVDDITAIMKQIEVYKGFPISKQAVYAWFREHDVDARWSK